MFGFVSLCILKMEVYFKFKSAKDYDSILIDGHFTLVLNLKEKIFESKNLGGGTDFDIVVTNAQTNEVWSFFGELVRFYFRIFINFERILILLNNCYNAFLGCLGFLSFLLIDEHILNSIF